MGKFERAETVSVRSWSDGLRLYIDYPP